ncbi:HD domain-containing protein [Bacillus wiedmannii]|uniref:HD domain-containing protein n=1 Tax=Bacillus wiedmannii TaxID=1890302 RepID=UPI0021D1AC78|nr:HD domain-containing protein [Bacillus wiedmannii]MCU5684020.1 HD domain-containing protein [Bacillus wiedmannii]
MNNQNSDLQNIISFVKELEHLKNTLRTAWTKDKRQESVAEHSWRLAIFSLVLEDHFLNMDFNKIIRMCLIHDLDEAYEGDTPAILNINKQEKLQQESQSISKLTASLSENTRNKIFELWEEYNKGETEEAKLVKALDKMETIIQHNHGYTPLDFNHEFNVTYGKEFLLHNPIIKILRNYIENETKNKIKQRDLT